MIDLGQNVKIRLRTDLIGRPIGLIIAHVRYGGRRKCTYSEVLFDTPEVRARFPGRPTWRITSPAGEPLSLWPSISCPLCRRHGFIFQGKWLDE